MHKILAVIRREFMTRVHTRAFVIGTVLGPLLMGFMFVLPILLSRRETAPKLGRQAGHVHGAQGPALGAACRQHRDARVDGLPRRTRENGPDLLHRHGRRQVDGRPLEGPELRASRALPPRRALHRRRPSSPRAGVAWATHRLLLHEARLERHLLTVKQM